MSLAFDLADFLWSENCVLPLRLRSYLAALAQRAHWSTGVGLTGRARLARCTGISVRQQTILRRELESLANPPVIIDWRPRHIEGRRTSDAYTIGFARCNQCGLNCKPGAHNGKPGGDQLQSLQRVSITGSPTGDTHCELEEKKLDVDGDGPQDPPSKTAVNRAGVVGWRGPNSLHVKMAAKLGLDVGEQAGPFRAWHISHPEFALTPRFKGYDVAFSGWLKRQPQPAAEQQAPAEAEPATPVGPTAAEIMAQRRRHRAASAGA